MKQNRGIGLLAGIVPLSVSLLIAGIVLVQLGINTPLVLRSGAQLPKAWRTVFPNCQQIYAARH
jgi:hypothetical protein